MRLLPSDPDVQTIVQRIESRILDLQPSFQRGEVWSTGKKRRLVDSVLREWHIPPVHVIETSSGGAEVLDGQQRLTAIRDFVRGAFTVDGSATPLNPDIQALDGLRYAELPPRWRHRFDQFSIRFFRLVDFEPEEAAELFFRLNQPTNLTSAEQRNAFYGAARDQVKALVEHMKQLNLGEESLGFSNSRMAYDDTIARLCYAADSGTLLEKVTAKGVQGKYRASGGYDPNAVTRVQQGLSELGGALSVVPQPVRLNKATLFSWVVFLMSHSEPTASDVGSVGLGQFIHWFEMARQAPTSEPEMMQLVQIFKDRSTARVADVSSVVIRDFVLWAAFFLWAKRLRVILHADNDRVARLAGGLLGESRVAMQSGSFEEWTQRALIDSLWGAVP